MYGLLGTYNFKKHLGFSRCTSIVRITSGARNFVETITQVLVISVVFFSVWQCILMNYEETIIYCLASTLYCILQPCGLRYALYCKCDASSLYVTDKKNTLCLEGFFFSKWISILKNQFFMKYGFKISWYQSWKNSCMKTSLVLKKSNLSYMRKAIINHFYILIVLVLYIIIIEKSQLLIDSYSKVHNKE